MIMSSNDDVDRRRWWSVNGRGPLSEVRVFSCDTNPSIPILDMTTGSGKVIPWEPPGDNAATEVEGTAAEAGEA